MKPIQKQSHLKAIFIYYRSVIRKRIASLSGLKICYILAILLLFCLVHCLAFADDIQLSKYFKQSEFACKHCGETRINFMLILKLEELRKKFNTPILITSGYRCPIHNQAVGGAKNSQHLYGNAVDIKVKGFRPSQVATMAKETGFTFTLIYPTWTHIDIRGLR